MLHCELWDDVVGIVGCSTIYQLVEWETVGVAVMISVCENPAVSPAFGPVQGRDFCVVLPVQRGLTCHFVLKQLHLILEPQTEIYGGDEVGFISKAHRDEVSFFARKSKVIKVK